jgi:hypothetical protein
MNFCFYSIRGNAKNSEGYTSFSVTIEDIVVDNNTPVGHDYPVLLSSRTKDMIDENKPSFINSSLIMVNPKHPFDVRNLL